ncbi:GNAT family N-acetyltransferase [Paracoccus luteus]|uniref:GNAT family N-acetyltransferase n=1 Tax=Paracoccus luteus TaxID=2508543 RepID=UPI00106F3F9F|nr:GNAT family N-acetyltransferase [Paracoccus luteus]
MTPQELAALHARCFVHPPPWPAAAFAGLLSSPGVFLLTHPPGDAPGCAGFLLGRAAAGEAEILTLAVDPASRRAGAGRALVAAFAAEACRRGAETAFLEVASDNAAALSLYARAGWQVAGRRRAYYAPGIDALVMRQPIDPAAVADRAV